MSYRNYYFINIRGKCNETTAKSVFDAIEKRSGEKFSDRDDEQRCAEINESVWDGMYEDVSAAAREFPDIIIQVDVEGDDRDDNWSVRFRGEEHETIIDEVKKGHFRRILMPGEPAPTPGDEKNAVDALYKRFKKMNDDLRKAIFTEIREKAKARGVNHIRFADLDITNTPSIQCLDSYDGWATLDAVHMDDEVTATIDFSDSNRNYSGRIGSQDTETLHEILAALRGVIEGIDSGEYAVDPGGTVEYAYDDEGED